MAKGLLLEKLTIFTRWDFTEELEFDCFMKIKKFKGNIHEKCISKQKFLAIFPNIRCMQYGVWGKFNHDFNRERVGGRGRFGYHPYF